MARFPVSAGGMWAVGLALVAGLIAWGCPCPAHASLAAREREGPRLRLAIGHPVHPGEKLSLFWQGADESIEELEILLSVDGGQTFSIWVSPSLDPRTGHYEWTVPKLGGSDAWLLVRFRRDGQEIEGPATRLSAFLTHGCDLPENALMPRESEAERESKPASGRAGSGSTRGGLSPCESNGASASSRRPQTPRIATLDVSVAAPFTGAAPRHAHPASEPPQFIPPRK